MNPWRYEIVAQRMHLDERSQTDRIAKVIGIDAFGQAGTRHWLGGQETCFQALAPRLTDEGEDQTSHVAAATNAADDDIRVIVGLRHLQECLLPDNSLMQQHVV